MYEKYWLQFLKNKLWIIVELSAAIKKSCLNQREEHEELLNFW
jgi:hypothetical protein